MRPNLQTPASDATSPRRITRWRFGKATRARTPSNCRHTGRRLALREGLVRDFPDDVEYRTALGATLNNLGVFLNARGHWDDALAMYLRAVEHSEAAFAKTPNDVLCGRFLATNYRNVAHAQNVHWVGTRKPSVGSGRRSNIVADSPATIPPCRLFVRLSTKRLTTLGNSSSSRTGRPTRRRRSESPRLALEEMPRHTPADWYNLACVQARSAAAIGEGKPDPSEQARSDRLRLADAAISSLARAIDGVSRTAEQIRNDADLEILRGRADFKNLVVRKKAAEEATALAERGDSGLKRRKAQEPPSCPGGARQIGLGRSSIPPEPDRPGGQSVRRRRGPWRPRPVLSRPNRT